MDDLGDSCLVLIPMTQGTRRCQCLGLIDRHLILELAILENAEALDEVVADLGKFPGPVWEMGQNFVKAMRAIDPRDKELATAS